RYTVPKERLKPAGNLIEVRVYDRGGEGGILGTVLLMTLEQAEALDRPPLELKGAKLDVQNGMAVVELRIEGSGWEATDRYAVAEKGRGFFQRTLELRATEGDGARKFDRVDMFLGHASGSLLSDARIAVPYTWPPIDRPLGEFSRDGNAALSCAEAVTGVAVYAAGRTGFAIGQYWERDWNTFVARGNGTDTSFTGQFWCQGYVKRAVRVPAGGQFVMVAARADRSAALRAIAEGWQRAGFSLAPLPAWAEAIALYSLHPGGTMGSHLQDLRSSNDDPPALRNFQRLQLPILKRLGINAIWFLPLWPRLYGVSDYWSLDRPLGTDDDLWAVVEDAHAAGIRVLCDLIPHGPHESSGLAKDHPELISRNEDGSIKYWWGCLCCDYAHPGWQDYMARVAEYWTKKADIDGWRVDCAGGAPPNWRPYGDNLPSWSGQWGGLRLMERVRKAMAALKADSVMLAESSNPPMLSQAHFIYDWPTERALFDVTTMPRQKWVAAIKRWLEFQQLSLPEGAAARLMRFTENHDQLHSAWQLGPDIARPVWALITLAEGFPLIYHEQEVGFEDFWHELLLARRRVPELHRGVADYSDAITCDAPDVLVFARKWDDRGSVVAINFSRSDRRCRVTWSLPPDWCRQARTLRSGEWVTIKHSPVTAGRRWLSFELFLKPFDWEVVVFRPQREHLASLASPGPMPPEPARPQQLQHGQPRVTLRLATDERTLTATRRLDSQAGELKEVVVDFGNWRAVVREGLIAGLWVHQVPLVGGAWVYEGTNPVSWQAPLCTGQRADGPSPPSLNPPSVLRQTTWSVSAASDGVRIDYSAATGGFVMSSTYIMRSEGTVSGEVKLIPAEGSGEPVLGELRAAIGGVDAERWIVRGLEGDVGGPFFVRHPTPNEITGRYWHPIQRLWESSVQPLSLERPHIGWQSREHWLWLELPDVATPADGLEDVYLREYAPDGQPGLTAYLSWMEGRSGRTLDPQRPFSVRFRLYVDKQPAPRTIDLPVKLWAEGANWYVQGDGYTACIGRSAGGQLRALWGQSDQPLLADAQTYTDYGILEMATDSLGNKVKEIGSTLVDFEPDCWIVASPDALTLRFRGLMRDRGAWQNLVNPRLQHETVWTFRDSPRIHIEHRVRVLTVPLPETRAFLAQVLNLPAVSRWRIEAGEKSAAGDPARDGAERIWESARVGALPHGFAFQTPAGSFRIENISPIGQRPQNVFLLRQRGSNRYMLFLAMLDGQPAVLDAAWRGVSYDMVAGR
ncbi:MAG: hypothetical protein H5T86_04020, partial [Armatimonadetes bacterium]|nr:hypothetical protein [Armatimonadota bacterium]